MPNECLIRHERLKDKCPLCGYGEAPGKNVIENIDFKIDKKWKHGFTVIVINVFVKYPFKWFGNREVDLGSYDTIEECERMITELKQVKGTLLHYIEYVFDSGDRERNLMDLIDFEMEIEERIE